MSYIAIKAFSIGVGGRMTSYAIGDSVAPAHAVIAPHFVEEAGAKKAKAEPKPEPAPEPEAKAEPKPKAKKKTAKKTGKKG